MDPDFSALDEYLDTTGCDGYLLDDGGENADQRYLSGFDAEGFQTLYTPGHIAVLVSGLEYTRATNESRADTVRRWSDYDYRDRREDVGRDTARKDVLAAFCREFDAESLAVPGSFPLGSGDALRDRGFTVTIDEDDVITDIRAIKTDEEIANIRATQAANQRAMERAESLLAAATVTADGVLEVDGEPLTSERVTEEIEVTLLRNGCSLDQTIVACGSDAAEPHNRGSGPLHAGETIVIDIFPKDKTTGYNGDMTRTFVVGEASPGAAQFYDVTVDAMDAAFDRLEPGVTGEAVHDAVCDVYEDAGYPTLRSDDTTETGFIHSTGHGVGLDVHEAPRLGDGGEPLEPGHVVTVEPGLYDPDVGGVRIEDLVVITESGYENLTDYPRRLEL
ncbi:MAG: M24 family metallopeptidase [Halobacteriaceae archaeon]